VSIAISTAEIDVDWFLSAEGGDFQVELENFIGPIARPFHDSGQAPYLPLPFSLTFKAVDDRPEEAKSIDVAMVTVTPPNEHGMVSFGHQPWFKRGYARRARKVVAEVNPNLIRTHGDCFLPVAAFDRFVEVTPPSVTRERLLQAVANQPDDRRAALEEIVNQVDPRSLASVASRLGTIDIGRLRILLGMEEPPAEARAIAEQVKRLVPDGGTIQIGVGTPSSYLARLGVFDDELDLGLHSEMVAPGIARLVEAGVINGSRKSIFKGKAVAVAWSGSDAHDLGIIDDNSLFELYEPDYLLNPWLMSQNHKQIALNNALSVDLIGQINVESTFGGRMLNGIGGQPDVHLGALYSKGGRAITLLQSTALGGSVSRIVAKFEAGEIVTIPRFFSDTVVTEYGVASLVGRNHRERAEALIAIAHPDFRSELRRAARGWLF
jgi:4-hydroxybutyrate CoA-transferase